MFFPLINEAFNILDEGIAARPSDIDVCYVHGYVMFRLKNRLKNIMFRLESDIDVCYVHGYEL